MDIIEFSKIKKADIFCKDFSDFKLNNTIEFSDSKIAVLYGPNGVGKTSLVKILSCNSDSEFKFNYDGKEYTNNDCTLFHEINDQNHRNIIKGETKDFLIGSNIRKEFELKAKLDKGFEQVLHDLIQQIKSITYINKASSKFLHYVSNVTMKSFVSDLVNNRSNGFKIEVDKLLDFIEICKNQEILKHNKEKLSYIKKEYDKPKSILKKIMDLRESNIKLNKHIRKFEEHDEALRILKKFNYVKECIVCDTEIECTDLLNQKTKSKEIIFKSLDDDTKKILEDIIFEINYGDPFNIKKNLTDAIKTGNKTYLIDLQNDIENHIKIIPIELNNIFSNITEYENLKATHIEYKKMESNDPEFEDKHITLIQELINDNITKKIRLKRDEKKNLVLMLDDINFLEKEREELMLSTGEQNFISLAFELFKAKNSNKEIIILDDPISSFDSIYKNRIAHLILYILKDKKQIILSHNVELIRLLEHQHQNCFNLYILNNTENEENGFVCVNKQECQILLYLDKLINLFSNGIIDEIEDKKLFLISMIPFMRGYANIIQNENIKKNLTKIMHGYNTDKIEIVKIFNDLFTQTLDGAYEISVKDIMELNINTIHIFKSGNKYPLLNKTLKHNLIYLYLRLNVEKTLTDKYAININKNSKLSQIILNAYKNSEDSNAIKNKNFLLSKKTLLNEFNHFEGNVNIFQPAIDISDSALNKEKEEILKFLTELN